MRWNRETPKATIDRSTLVGLLLMASLHMMMLKVGSGPVTDLVGPLTVRVLNLTCSLIFFVSALYQAAWWLCDRLRREP